MTRDKLHRVGKRYAQWQDWYMDYERAIKEAPHLMHQTWDHAAKKSRAGVAIDMMNNRLRVLYEKCVPEHGQAAHFTQPHPALAPPVQSAPPPPPQQQQQQPAGGYGGVALQPMQARPPPPLPAYVPHPQYAPNVLYGHAANHERAAWAVGVGEG